MRISTRARAIAWTLALLLFPDVAAARAPAAPASPPEQKNLVLRSADGRSSLRLLGLLQIQHAYGRIAGSPGGALFVNRARVGLLGGLLGGDLRTTLVAEFSGESPRLMFLNVDYTFVPDRLSLRVGQFKRPFSRPFMTLASDLSMIDRPSPVGPGVFGDNADIGVMLHNGTTTRFEYAVGVFNGAGPNVVPDRVHPLLAARVAFNTRGMTPYSDSDLDGGAPRFSVAAAGLVDLDADGDHGSFTSGLVDVMFKARGLALASALYAGSRQAGPRWTDQRFHALGHYTQLGYVLAGRFEPVVRYSFVLPGGDGTDQHDVAGGLNVFIRGHAFKWQTVMSARFQHPDGRATPDLHLQSQLSVAF